VSSSHEPRGATPGSLHGAPHGSLQADAGGDAPRSRAATELRRLTLAVTFLTSLPLRVEGDVSPADLWGSMGWYPLVGLAMGAAAWGVFAAASWLLPGTVAAALVVLLLEAFTRGLHLDGLMDTCDGYFSGAPRERALEIMKDSHAGAMGVAGAVLVVVLKVAARGALTRAGAAAPLLAGWAAARALPAADVYWFPYARAAGTGEPFTRQRTRGPLLLAGGLLAVAVVAAIVVTLLGGGPAGALAPLAVVAAALAVPLLLQLVVARRLGGLTGDVYGMGIELAEVAALVAGCALLR
jgi:adenosylcobinamide-GDP ribazoletransferase